MKFEAVLRKEKLKQIQKVLLMSLAILKSKPMLFSVRFIYVAAEQQIRILIQNDQAPIIIVLSKQMIISILSISKNQPSNISLGFQFMRGMSFLQNFIDAITQSNPNQGMQERTIKLKLSKQEEYRCMEIRTKDKTRREQVEKPIKNEDDIFAYEWIDGVQKRYKTFHLHMAGLISILKVISKAKSSRLIQTMSDRRVLKIELNFQTQKTVIEVKSLSSQVSATCTIGELQGEKYGICNYQIKIDDSEILAQILKIECGFVLGMDNNLTVCYGSDDFNCEIWLKNIVVLQSAILNNPEQRLKKQIVHDLR